jgi:hypothetical protein
VTTTRGFSHLAVVAGLALAVVLAGCASGPTPGGVISWRELTIDLPGQWVEINRTDSSLTVANSAGDPQAGLRGDQQVATQFMIVPGVRPDDLRDFVADEGGEIERDESIEVGGLGGTLVQYTFTTGGMPLRERVIVIASRELVILQQPTPMQGETDGPDWFLDYLDEFDALLQGITFGAPPGFMDR